MSSAAWMAQQLQSAADVRHAMPLEKPRYNPRPAGVILHGSASHAVLTVLRERPGAWLTHAQLIVLTRRGTKAVCWALLYLRAQGLVESAPDDLRNSRYRRYRAPFQSAPTITGGRFTRATGQEGAAP